MVRSGPLGGLLRGRREERGLTIEQAEEATRIRRRYLQALEDESFADLPGEVYVRGFLRLYAEYLGLDPAEVLSLYRPLRRPTPADLVRPPGLERTRESIGGRLLAIALVAVVAVAALYVYQQQSGQPPASPAGAPPPQATSIPASPTSEAAVSEAPSTSTPTPIPTATPTVTSTPLPRQVMVRVDTLGPVGIDAWVDGQLVHSATLQTGNTIRWQGETVRILAADAGNVVLTVDGKHVGIFGPKGQRKEFEWVSPARSAETQAGGQPPPAPPVPSGGR